MVCRLAADHVRGVYCVRWKWNGCSGEAPRSISAATTLIDEFLISANGSGVHCKMC